MRDVYKNIGEYNPAPENKILIVFDDMIADMVHNKKLDSIVTELFSRERKLNISFAFITQSYFKVPKMLDRIQLIFLSQKFQIIEYFKKFYATIHPILKLKISLISTENLLLIHIRFVNDTTLASDNPLRFRKLFLKYNKNHDN